MVKPIKGESEYLLGLEKEIRMIKQLASLKVKPEKRNPLALF
jgi:hypothetical protein